MNASSSGIDEINQTGDIRVLVDVHRAESVKSDSSRSMILGENVGSNKRMTISEDEDEEGFTTVEKKRGAKKRCFTSHINNSQNKNNIKFPCGDQTCVEVGISSKEVLPKQIGMAKILQQENLTGIIKVKFKSPYKVVITVSNDDDAGKIIKCDNFRLRGWLCRKIGEMSYCYGIIKEVDLDLDEECLKNIIQCEKEVISVKRINKKKDGIWKKSELVRVCFQGPTLPSYISVYGLRMKVEPYIFPVSQCSKCWKYGHYRNFCPSKIQLCPKCGGEHENCTTSTFKCINCKGNHMSLLKSACPTFYKEKNIREIMSNDRCSYKVALNKINRKHTDNSYIDIDTLSDVSTIVRSNKTFAEVLQRPSEGDDSSINLKKKSNAVRGEPVIKNKNKNSSRNTKKVSHEYKENIRKEQEVVINKNKKYEQEETKGWSGTFDILKKIIGSDNNFGTKFTMIITYLWTEVKTYLQGFINLEAIFKMLLQNG